ncbi:MFS transporter [Kitasatospora terrestris]|uniref:MFS transporter n=1 Tax=Kitasatospora terrestris TaxID=258051 RepID=UPI0031EEE922
MWPRSWGRAVAWRRGRRASPGRCRRPGRWWSRAPRTPRAAAGTGGYGAASVAASLVVPLVVHRLPRVPLMVFSWVVLGIAFVLLPSVAPDLTGICVTAAVAGAAMPWGIAALDTLISEQTSGAERRAAFGAQTVLHSGGASLGLLAGGALIGWAGVGPVLIATGLTQVLAAAGGALWAWRVRRTPTSPGVNRAPSRAARSRTSTIGA